MKRPQSQPVVLRAFSMWRAGVDVVAGWVLPAVLYGRAWARLRLGGYGVAAPWRLLIFYAAGLAALAVALLSPLIIWFGSGFVLPADTLLIICRTSTGSDGMTNEPPARPAVVERRTNRYGSPCAARRDA
jgi:hypothetical protein